MFLEDEVMDFYSVEEMFTRILGGDTQDTYQAGFCHVLALELVTIIPNSKVVAVMDYDLNIEHEVLTHAFVKHLGNYIDVSGAFSDVRDILDSYEDHGEQYLNSSMSRKDLYAIAGRPTGSEIAEAKKVAKRVATMYLKILKGVHTFD